jgi:membrane-bound ClpP family serine protease
MFPAMPKVARGTCPALAQLLAGILVALSAAPAAAQARPAAERDGMFVTVPSPITQDAVSQIKTKVALAFERQGRRVRTIVFDFNPGGAANGTSDYGPCLTLKNYILDLAQRRVELNKDYPQVNTIAFLHGKVSRHTVLAVLACAELIMAPESSLGEVRGGPGERLPEEVELAYRRVAEKSRWGDLVLRMLDPELPVRKVRTRDGAVAYWSPATVEEHRKGGEEAVPDPGAPADLERGSSLFSAAQAFRYGLAREVPAERAKVTRILDLPGQSVREDWLAGQVPVPCRIDVNGNLDAGRLESLRRRVNTALRRGANLLILQLSCEGGDTKEMGSAARFLSDLPGPGRPVKTVAYIPPGRSLGAATFLALGCSEIVMSSTAALGDFEYLAGADAESMRLKREALVELAQERGYPPLLFQATLDRDLVVYGALSRDHTYQIITEAQKQHDDALPADRQQWINKTRIPRRPGEFLKLDAKLAKDWGVALYNDVESPEELYRRYNLPAGVSVSRDDWLDRVAEFFREPVVNVLLIMIGIAGLILELKMPGLSLPGVIAAVCFVLFFWAHSFVGEFTMLAVLLFVLGLVLIGLEVFVMPGFGVTGVSGVVLLITSLVLVTLERMPESTQDWINLGTTLVTFVSSLVAALAVAFTLAWYLPHIPYANRLILPPPAEEEAPDGESAGGGPPQAAAALLGAIGEAATPLRPAGKARFGDDFLDVISEGDYVNPGSRVQVVEIEGNRIVVKEV